MAPAYLQLLRCAFHTPPDACRLPLYSYTAAGWSEAGFAVAGVRIDPDCRQDLDRVDLTAIERNAERTLRRFRGNRLVKHLVENCVHRYGCPAARNFVMGRWECPLPSSRACNSRCIACISDQRPGTGVNASQARIEFTPTVDEIVEVAVGHLEKAQRAVVSFGQGCEGEPLLVGGVIEQAIRETRKRCDQGIINLNTNGSLPQVIEKLCVAGLDSVRVSVNSAQEHYYDRYYRPQGYTFTDVVESLRIVRKFGKWSSMNYLMFPGFTDHPQEMAALFELLDKVKLDMIQTRNLNMDPEWYVSELGLSDPQGVSIGMSHWLRQIGSKFPQLVLGYFNPPREVVRQHR